MKPSILQLKIITMGSDGRPVEYYFNKPEDLMNWWVRQ